MRSSPTPIPTPTKRSSIACSPARIMASAWPSPGSTPRGTRIATASSKTATPGNGSGATGSSGPSTRTCLSINSRSGNWPATCCPAATIDQKIASGFNRNHLLNGEGGAIAEEQRFVNLFDRVDTTATTWLGLTMACAQCHDHKYDPITQRDYYGLLDAFNRVPGNWHAPVFLIAHSRRRAVHRAPHRRKQGTIAELRPNLNCRT